MNIVFYQTQIKKTELGGMGWEKLFRFAVYVDCRALVWRGEVKLTIIVRWGGVGWDPFGALLQSNWSVMALVGLGLRF